MTQEIINFIKELYGNKGFIPLHEPFFCGNEKVYLNECIDSTFVSSVGKFVDQFEEQISRFTNSNFAVATVNGTSALHVALLLAGVEQGDEVITQPLTFVATCNALSYVGAYPVFIDVDKETLSLSPEKMEHFLKQKTEQINGVCRNRVTKRRIKAIVPMHTFGLPARIEELVAIAERYHVELIEDAAEQS
jgi:perosamine synthetase